MARIVVLDIERQSGVADGIWQLKQTWINPNQMIVAPSTICFSYKWLGEEKTHFVADWSRGGHKRMVAEAWNVMDEADCVIGWNSKGFDVKHLRTEFLLAGMAPPSPHKDIDLMLTARKNFGFLSNRMAYVAEQLHAGQKLATGGADLWRKLRVAKGDELKQARRLMEEYNRQDVALTEELYWLLLPWVAGLNIPLYDGGSEVPACANCGSTRVQYRGYQVAATRSYRRFQCQGCGKWGRDTRADASVASAGI
jgi:hypothetical protein